MYYSKGKMTYSWNYSQILKFTHKHYSITLAWVTVIYYFPPLVFTLLVISLVDESGLQTQLGVKQEHISRRGLAPAIDDPELLSCLALHAH